jgi:hypothetical protein
MSSSCLLLLLFISINHLCRVRSHDDARRPLISSIEQYAQHHRFGTVDNVNVHPNDDCALRAFVIEMATYIAPVSSRSNWNNLSRSALQMNECHDKLHVDLEFVNTTKTFEKTNEIKRDACQHAVFVHDTTGDDSFSGTLEKPMKTIQAALLMTRVRRLVYGYDKTLCIIIRGGIYYLGTNATTTTNSEIGAIALDRMDSNLVIENYQDERVILSGGTRLELQWSLHARTTTGGRIMKAQLPVSIDLEHFNELYIDERRAIVAKYPNGDPSTQGLYAHNPGFSFDTIKWWPSQFNPSIDVNVKRPYRNGTVFPYYQIGVGGGASVFNPSQNFWSTSSPPGGSNYAVPRGVTVKMGALPRIGNWSKPSTGFVHAFHSGYWASWVFEIDSINSTANKIMFGRGGFQEARGSRSGGAFYVANIFEELDSPNEWFLDRDTRALYFMPNETMPDVFVASQISCLISVRGNTIDDSAENITIRGLTLTQTSNTYMHDYMVPSGGDWAVHRGGTIYLLNSRYVTIIDNLFTQLGSNGVALIDHNTDTSIVENEFVWLADSAIILVGSTDGIDGFSVNSQPTNTLIRSNLIHETGIYVKQSSPVFIAVSRSVFVIDNLMFNVPRAGINVNDGFYGNHTISGNVLFNTVRETSDHGPINTWDRQPFLTDGLQSGQPSLRQHQSYIHHNTLFNNYHSLWPIDHDDGSCFYEDSYNFQVYGGKKNYLGHSKIDHHEIYVYSDVNSGDFDSNVCLGDYAPTRGASGWNESWIENVCVLYRNPVPYKIGNCDTANLYVPYMANNRIYIPSSMQVAFICETNGTSVELSLKQWQSYGVDIGTTVQSAPDVHTVIDWGRQMLQTTRNNQDIHR